jgi:cytochrome c
MRMNKVGFRPGVLGAAALALFAVAAPSAQAADAEKGKKIFEVCQGCHNDAGRSVGPSLLGVYGRTSGSLEGYKYSPAMKRSKLVWDEKNLHDYIADPQKKVKANNMSFKGIRSSADIDDLVEFLKTYK